jgi:hypothetical protein
MATRISGIEPPRISLGGGSTQPQASVVYVLELVIPRANHVLGLGITRLRCRKKTLQDQMSLGKEWPAARSQITSAMGARICGDILRLPFPKIDLADNGASNSLNLQFPSSDQEPAQKYNTVLLTTKAICLRSPDQVAKLIGAPIVLQGPANQSEGPR